MRGVSKFWLALVVVLLSAGLAACGSGDSGDSTSASSTATAPESSSATTPENQGTGQSGSGAEKESGDDNGSSGSDSDDKSSEEEGSASFRTPGGDNSIQDYGEEASSDETAAANGALAAYLTARAEDDWAKQCALLAKTAVEPLEQLASRSSQFKDKGCAAILEALVGQGPPVSRANPMTSGVAGLRFEGDRAFALFHGSHGADYFVPMIKEDGKWKVGAIAPSEFP